MPDAKALRSAKGAGVNFSISKSFTVYGYRQKDIEKARTFEVIADEGNMTRKQLYQTLGVRPNNISTAVQELIDANLIYEDESIKSSRQGRPQIRLRANVDKLAALSVWVASSNLILALTNIAGEVLAEKRIAVAPNTDNERFMALLTDAVDAMLPTVSVNQELIGIGFALPGFVIQPEKTWVFNSRWPNISHLDLSVIEKRYDTPIIVGKIMDSELEAFIAKNPDLRTSSTFLLHWGYGIGAAYAYDGAVQYSNFGGFCEMGHIKVARGSESLPCECHERGCLETVAAGWALLPKLQKPFGLLPEEEKAQADMFKTLPLVGNPDIEKALDSVVATTDTVYRVLFPQQIIAYGPFLRNAELSCLFTSRLRACLPSYTKDYVQISVLDDDLTSYNSYGATLRFFKKRLEELLVAVS